MFFTMIFGIIELSRLMYYQVSLQRAVAVASRCAGVVASSCNTDALIISTAANSGAGLILPASAFTVQHVTCGVKVSASLPFTFRTGFIRLPTQTLRASYCHPRTQ